MNGLSFENVLKKKLIFLKGQKLLAAFSGGKDSLAMVDFLNVCKNEYSFDLTACHVNHGLRQESDVDESFCKTWCEKNNVKFIAVKLETYSKNTAKNGVEDWARRKRYEALEKVAKDFESDLILTAHTFDDRLESFFTDLYTGASIFTLGGISFLKGKICRPMLEIKTVDVEDYLKRKGLTPIFDASNDDIRFTRNKIRRKVMPALFDAGGDFVNTVLRIQEESASLSAGFADITVKAVLENTPHLTTIDKNIFESFSTIEKTYALGKLFGEKFRSSKALVNEALKLLERDGSGRINLPDEFIFEVSMKRLRIFKKSLIELFSVEKDERTDTIYFLGVDIKFYGEYSNARFIVRSRLEGDRFRGKKLKDLFIDKKIDSFFRDRAVLVASLDGEILWAEFISINDAKVVVKRLY